ncbi:MAG: aminotransferase class IV [Cytophagales bacterium]|nr:aminotransferase class IV [Cytophagales bacterium]MDW8384132.1 aminotransferase class IV [Flammeovirgaceae bacterium]
MYFSRKTIVFFDGKFQNATEVFVNPYSQTLHYGFGVIDGLRSYKTDQGVQIFQARQHYQRFLSSCEKLGIKLSFSAEELVHISYQLLENNGLTDAYIRPIVFMEQNMGLTETLEHHLLITAWRWRNFSHRGELKVYISDFVRPVHHPSLVDAKLTGNYYSTILATIQARKMGYDEVLLKDADGFISEGPGSNFFFEKDGKLFTPQLGKIFPGITRSVVIKIAHEMGIEVIEGKFRSEDLQEIDGAFFTSTPSEVAVITSINHQKFRKKPEDTIGFKVGLRYKHKVSLEEYDHYSII